MRPVEARLAVVVGEFRRTAGDGETGLVFPLDDFDGFEAILRKIYDEPSIIERMRPACLEEAKKFLPEAAAAPLFEMIDAE